MIVLMPAMFAMPGVFEALVVAGKCLRDAYTVSSTIRASSWRSGT